MNNIEVIEVSLSGGQTQGFENIALPNGNCTNVAAVVIAGTPDVNINISLKSNDGTDIIKPHSYKFWEQTGGGHLDSLKPVNFKCNRNVKVYLNAPIAPKDPVTFQLMFYII